MQAIRRFRLNARIFRVAAVVVISAPLFSFSVQAQTVPTQSDTVGSRGIWQDAKLYATAPLRWDSGDWLYLGGSIAAIGLAHHYDEDVRRHFVDAKPLLAQTSNTHDLSDAAPAVVAIVGTWALASLTDDAHGRRETWSMAEAAAFSTTTAFLFKFAAGRERPNETADANQWRASSDSFPSLHTTAAFAIGTVLAESGNDDYRWFRRVLGYGIGIATGYQRVKHNAHWLSDNVAAAALGIASARFVLNRDNQSARAANISVVPLDGGLQLTYSVALR